MLTQELTQLYGNMRIWITEYGYQTNPPDTFFGVTLRKAGRLPDRRRSRSRASNPRVDMFLWFLLKDESRPERLAVRADDRERRQEAELRGVRQGSRLAPR